MDLKEPLRAAIGDRYEVTGHLGSGGMAHVYRARSLADGRLVAIKVIRDELVAAVSVERFLREIRITGELKHPAITPLIDSGAQDDALFFVMPLFEGESLKQHLRREGPLGLEECLRIATRLADALEYAHSKGIVHRDVKPSNIFLGEEGAVLGDFGVALALAAADQDRLTESEVIVGTAEYASPEQFNDLGPVDHRSDIYSFGCVAYEMLTGQLPFPGRSRLAIMASHLQGTAPSPAVLRADLPIEVVEIVDKCLRKVPGDRFQSAADLRDALNEALSAWKAGSSLGFARPPRQSGARAGAVVATVAVLGLVASWLGWRAIRPSASALDPGKVVVFPLADRGGGGPGGPDAGVMIINALTHAGTLRAIDGWQRLTADERGDARLLTRGRASEIARLDGAGHFITGGVTYRSDSVGVLLVLHDVVADSVQGQASASGRVGETTPDQLAVQAMIDLLPTLLDPGRDVDLSAITERRPAAIARWIVGDRAYRLNRFDEALSAYRGAVEADSAIALAALKGAQAASWVEEHELAIELLDIAAQHDSLLPPRHRSFAEGLRAYLEGDGDVAVARFREALAADREWAEAWTALGETYRHLITSEGVPRESDIDAFTRAYEEDPEFLPPLVHLAEYAVLNGEIENARTMIARLSESGIADEISWVVIMEACAGGAVPRESLDVPASPTRSLLNASLQFAAGNRAPRCAEAGFRSALARQGISSAEEWAALRGLMGVLVNEDRVSELDSLLDDGLRRGQIATRFLYTFAVLAGADVSEGAAAVDAEAAAAWGPDYQDTRPLTAWVLALWNSTEGDFDTAEALVRRLEDAPVTEGGHEASLRASARAHLLAARGDSAAALAVLEALDERFPRSVIDYGLFEPLAPERLLHSELLLWAGRYEEAFQVARTLDHPGSVMFVPFVARSLRVRLWAAEALSHPLWARQASEIRSRLEAMGRDDLLSSR